MLGEPHPLAVEMPQHSSRVAQTVLAVAHAILDGMAVFHVWRDKLSSIA